jgi:asparagine synthetase B (glutamine-hydrolysing)
MRTIEGPWAFAFFQKSSSTLFFGRDPVGRRSLLISYKNHVLALSSVFVPADAFEWREVDTRGKYFILNLDLDQILLGEFSEYDS